MHIAPTLPASLDPNRALITVITTFEVQPLRADELVRALEGVIETVLRKQPGFVSSSIHRALDGTHVASYSQWASEAELDAALASDAVQRLSNGALAQAVRATTVRYRVRSSFGR